MLSKSPRVAVAPQARQGERLTVEGLSVNYGAAKVLANLALEVAPGEVVGIGGANGAGKTTLLRALSGAVRRTFTTLEYGGRTLGSTPRKTALQGTAHVLEGRQLFANLTVIENLRVGEIAGGHKGGGSEMVNSLIESFPKLEPLLQRKAGVLSGGQQQLVAIARGLAARPSLLLIDELSLGLSPSAAEEITTGVLRICRQAGSSVVLVDQNLHLLHRHSDRCQMLKSGRLTEMEVADLRLDDDLITDVATP